jgi:hypothetical protein
VPWSLPGDEQKRPPERIDWLCGFWLSAYLLFSWTVITVDLLT